MWNIFHLVQPSVHVHVQVGSPYIIHSSCGIFLFCLPLPSIAATIADMLGEGVMDGRAKLNTNIHTMPPLLFVVIYNSQNPGKFTNLDSLHFLCRHLFHFQVREAGVECVCGGVVSISVPLCPNSLHSRECNCRSICRPPPPPLPLLPFIQTFRPLLTIYNEWC